MPWRLKNGLMQDGSKSAPSLKRLSDLKRFSNSIACRKGIKQWYA